MVELLDFLDIPVDAIEQADGKEERCDKRREHDSRPQDEETENVFRELVGLEVRRDVERPFNQIGREHRDSHYEHGEESQYIPECRSCELVVDVRHLLSMNSPA